MTKGPEPSAAVDPAAPHSPPIAVVAIGGNSLIKHRELRTVEDQYRAICETAAHLVGLVRSGYRLVISHGNGPQVGFIMLRSEIAREYAGLHHVPLSSAVADTQGAIGLQIQQALANELAGQGLDGHVVTVVTQVEVDPADPGFESPSKPVGEFYSADQLDTLRSQHPDWILVEDADRGYRRVVPSPAPLEIVEQDAIDTLLAGGHHVVAAGGGGIPVVRTPDGLHSVDAVIDKDMTSSLLASNLGAPLLVISTAVEHVMVDFGTPDARPLTEVRAAEMERYLAEGHFAPGSMAPKIRAAIGFLHRGGQRVIITNPQHLDDAIEHGQGTHIVP